MCYGIQDALNVSIFTLIDKIYIDVFLILKMPFLNVINYIAEEFFITV